MSSAETEPRAWTRSSRGRDCRRRQVAVATPRLFGEHRRRATADDDRIHAAGPDAGHRLRLPGRCAPPAAMTAVSESFVATTAAAGRCPPDERDLRLDGLDVTTSVPWPSAPATRSTPMLALVGAIGAQDDPHGSASRRPTLAIVFLVSRSSSTDPTRLGRRRSSTSGAWRLRRDAPAIGTHRLPPGVDAHRALQSCDELCIGEPRDGLEGDGPKVSVALVLLRSWRTSRSRTVPGPRISRPPSASRRWATSSTNRDEVFQPVRLPRGPRPTAAMAHHRCVRTWPVARWWAGTSEVIRTRRARSRLRTMMASRASYPDQGEGVGRDIIGHACCSDHGQEPAQAGASS